jgi:hypothetical protein
VASSGPPGLLLVASSVPVFHMSITGVPGCVCVCGETGRGESGGWGSVFCGWSAGVSKGNVLSVGAATEGGGGRKYRQGKCMGVGVPGLLLVASPRPVFLVSITDVPGQKPLGGVTQGYIWGLGQSRCHMNVSTAEERTELYTTADA